MKKEIIEEYFISNGSIFPLSEIDRFPITEPTIYEVIRVIDGVPVFLEDHLARLQASAASLNVNVQALIPVITAAIKELIKINNSPAKNVKIVVYNLGNLTPDYIAAFIHSSYPTENQYKDGVHTITVNEERPNPNAKIINSRLRDLTNAMMKESNAYEALLINSKGEVTEGSRSNLFFVEKGKVYTAPAEDVLIGITRKHIIKACSNLGLGVLEQPIPISMLEQAEGAFISGTSPKVLPIASIDERVLDSAKYSLVAAIIKEYDNVLKHYIDEHK